MKNLIELTAAIKSRIGRLKASIEVDSKLIQEYADKNDFQGVLISRTRRQVNQRLIGDLEEMLK